MILAVHNLEKCEVEYLNLGTPLVHLNIGLKLYFQTKRAAFDFARACPRSKDFYIIQEDFDLIKGTGAREAMATVVMP